MQEPDLLSRIDALEEQLTVLRRRHTKFVIAVAVMAGVFVVTISLLVDPHSAMTVSNRVTGTLLIEDENGRGAILIGVEDDGTAAISLRGEGDTKRALLATSGDGTTLLSVFDRNQEPRLCLGVVGDQPVVVFCDEQGQNRLVQKLGAEGAPLIRLIDSEGSDLIRLPEKD